MKKLFKRKCQHEFVVIEKSNAIQFDSKGYPLRLCVCRCQKCGYSDQIWIDVPKFEANEITTGESFELEWTLLDTDKQKSIC